jgi:hypothetical protein
MTTYAEAVAECARQQTERAAHTHTASDDGGSVLARPDLRAALLRAAATYQHGDPGSEGIGTEETCIAGAPTPPVAAELRALGERLDRHEKRLDDIMGMLTSINTILARAFMMAPKQKPDLPASSYAAMKRGTYER